MRRYLPTPATVIGAILGAIILLWAVAANSQTHTMPGSNVVPSGASLTINSGGSITAAAGSTVTGFGGGGTPGGSNTQVQFNDGGVFGGDADMVWNKTTNMLTLNSGDITLRTVFATLVNHGTTVGQDVIYYDGGAGTRYGSGIAASELQIFIPNAGHVSWNKGGDLQTSGTNELMRLDAATGTLNVVSGFKLGGAEFPIASNGLVKRTAANTYAAAVAGTDYQAALTLGTGVTTALGVNVGTAGAFVVNGGALGTPSGGTLTSCTGLPIGSGVSGLGASVGTFLATPSSANLRGALTDENGTGAALFSGATTPDFTTGFTIGAAAGSGKVMRGNGTNFVPSTETYAVPGTSGNVLTSDGTNWTSAAPVVTASNTLTFTNKRITNRSLVLAAPTPAPSINADNFDVVHVTGLTGAITSITMTGTPVEGDTLRIDFTDNGTARAITLGGSFEAGAAPLPTTTVISTRLDTVFYWNTATSKWRCQASSASPTYPGASATSGKIVQSDGTNFVASTPTWPTTAGTTGYLIQSNGTNFVTYPTSLEAASTATVSAGYAADTYLAGSTVTIAAGDWKVQGVYHCKFDMTKTGAGAATPIVTVRMGTLGTTGDASIGTLTWAVGTGVVDTGVFDVDVVFRTVGSGTSAVIQMMGVCAHHLAATGLTTTGASGTGIIVGTSAGFNSTTQTKIGLSFNGGSSFSGTNTLVTATLHQP